MTETAKNSVITKTKLEQLQEKKQQLENQIKALQAREKEKERKERTRRLIEKGALSEKFFNCESLSPQDFETLLKEIVSIQAVKNLISSYTEKNNAV